MTVKTEAAPAGDNFAALLAEIGDTHKALPSDADTAADDAAIADAADADKDKEKPGAAKPAAKDKDADVTKSYTIKLEDGTEVVAVDGTELIKSLTERLDAGETQTHTVITQLFDIVKSQGAAIKRLSEAGKGRKAVVAINEKPKDESGDINKALPDGEISEADFMAKSMVAYTGKKISAHQLQVIETCRNTNRKIPDDIIRAVMAS